MRSCEAGYGLGLGFCCGCMWMGMWMDGPKCRFHSSTRGWHLKGLRPAAEKDRCHALTAFEVDRIREHGSQFLSNAVSKKRTKNNTLSPLPKRLASRFYQVKTGHCLSGKYLHWTKNRPTLQCWWYPIQTREHLFKVSGVEGPTENSVGGGAEGDWEVEEQVEDPGPPGRREMQPGGTRLPRSHGGGKESAG